jgi:hypothetical protein
MEVDGMYENTPWERLSLYAPWIGGIALIVAIAVYFMAKRREDEDPDGAEGGMHVARLVGAYAAVFMTLGILFTIMWRPAHDVYPHAFGRAALGVGAGALVLAGIVALARRSLMHAAIIYGTLTASVCVAAAISAFSHTIIAEGQVTAMVLPVGYAAVALIAATLAAPFYRNPLHYEAAIVVLFAALAFGASELLPVVQFRKDDSVYPVIGGFYIVVLGRLARVHAFPPVAALIVAVTAIAIGYFIQYWYGIAIAAVGLSISGGWGLLHQPSEEYLPRHSTRG